MLLHLLVHALSMRLLRSLWTHLTQRRLDVEASSGNDVDSRPDADVFQERRFPRQPEWRVLDDGAAAETSERFDALDDADLSVGVVQNEVVHVTVAKDFDLFSFRNLLIQLGTKLLWMPSACCAESTFPTFN